MRAIETKVGEGWRTEERALRKSNFEGVPWERREALQGLQGRTDPAGPVTRTPEGVAEVNSSWEGRASAFERKPRNQW